MNWQGKKVLVTGGAGFVGSHVVELLVARGAHVTVFGRSDGGANLDAVRDRIRFVTGDCGDDGDARSACEGQEIVMNLAARVGGIEYNRTHHASIFRDNMRIAMAMTEAAHTCGVDRFLTVSSACIYPHDAVIPTPETEGFRGEPEPTNGGYGWAKRMAEKTAMYYAEQYGMNIGIVRPYNIYGPRDHFDPERSHVIPALIRRVFDGENPLRVWGSGRQTRAFLYVEDAARGMVEAIEKYPVADPVNLGTDEEISIADVVAMIVRISGIETTIEFDTSKPDGSPRRNSDNTKAAKHIGFTADTPFEEGLTRTIEWYKHEYRR